MALVRVNRNLPARYTGTLFDEFDRVFDELATPLFSQFQTVNYPLDLYETDDHVVLEMAVPGLRADDLDISVEGRQLGIRGKLPEGSDEADRRYWLQSIPRGDMNRNVRLPTNVDVDGIEARVRDGMLVLRMPKVAEAKVRKISVERD
jgi:HSP20 family protein